MIRYFCHVEALECPDKDNWGDLGFDYFNMLRQIDDVRVIPLNNLMLSSINPYLDPQSRWAEHNAHFGVPIPGAYLNVVCGSIGNLRTCYTYNVSNIGITMALNGDEELGGSELLLYDTIICPTEMDVTALSQYANVLHIPPEPDRVSTIICEFFT